MKPAAFFRQAVPPGISGTAALVTGVALLVLVTAIRGPATTLIVMAVLLIPWVTVKAPEVVVAAGVVGTLAGGSFSYLSSISAAVLVLGAGASTVWIAVKAPSVRWQRLVLPAVILIWLGLRVALERDLDTVTDIVKCLSVLVLVLHCVDRRRDLVAALAAASVVFVLASAWFGIDNASGTRFQGISGNPNRMVFGLLLFLPFLLSMLGGGRRSSVRVLALATSVSAVVLVGLSGSAQGVVGLATILAMLMACLAVGLPRGLRAMTVLVALASLALALRPVVEIVASTQDLRTLSGRTSIFAAAVQDVLRDPFAGSGRQHFSEGAVVGKSAHSVVLALATTGGIPLALAWVAVLVLLLIATVALVRARNPLAAAPAVLVAEQFVQTVELYPFTWVVVAMFLLRYRGFDRAGRAVRVSVADPLAHSLGQRSRSVASYTTARRST